MGVIKHGLEPWRHVERPDRRRRLSLSQVEVRCRACHSCLLTALGHVLWRGICSEATNAHESFLGISLGAPLFDQRKRRWGVRIYHSTKPRKRSCVSITDNSRALVQLTHQVVGIFAGQDALGPDG